MKHTFNFYGFRNAVMEGRTYEDIAFALDISRSMVSSRLTNKYDFKLKEYLHWCDTFDISPMEYIELEVD